MLRSLFGLVQNVYILSRLLLMQTIEIDLITLVEDHPLLKSLVRIQLAVTEERMFKGV